MAEPVSEKAVDEELAGGIKEKQETRDLEPALGVVEDANGYRLQPQPTADPLDPLNWSSVKKHGILAIVMALYFMFTYVTTATVPSFPQLQDQYRISADLVNWTVAIPALGLALGPLFWSSPADIIGRRVIFIAGTLVALGATIGAAKAPNYGGYMAARLFQGLGVSPAATVGLSIINDLFFEHERGQKIGLWVLAIDLGAVTGPLIGGFMDLVDQFWIQWLTAIMFAAILLAEIFFLPETLYPREHMLARAPRVSSCVPETGGEKAASSILLETDLPRTTKLPFLNFKPVPGMRHPKPWDSPVRVALLFKFPVVPLAVFIFCFGWYWWLLSILTMLPSGYANYSPQIQGLFTIGLILGTLFSEVFCSGRLSDWIVIRLAKKKDGVKLPEMRLWLAYPAAALTAFAAGIQMGNTAVCAYIVDSYPLQAMAVITFYSVFLNLSAFIEPFFIVPWVNAMGYTWAFAIQGMLTFFFCVPAMALVQKFGPTMRRKAGNPSWVNPEYDSFK